ncbi:MAG: ribonuclease P protein subunit [Candidatus Aenigmarchaeota archaeon]|nr:ribonuclease P protein subunit [Candidatus Aenigmarchaeota archaeon]
MRTPRNIKQHELIGLDCEVVSALNASHIGLRGRIVDETLKTMILKKKDEKKRIPKKGSIFRLVLGGVRVDLEGDHILARPEDRIKKTTKRW